MINLITGTPGAGKTYLAVKLLTEKYFYWHRKDKQFYRNEKSKKYTIFTNISGLNLPHKNLDDIFKEQNLTFEQFFTPAYQDKLHKKYADIIYVIDECQQFIPSRFSDKDVILYFDTHRHYGDKIWLVTQDFKKICISINTLVELEYRAVKATFSILGEFRYNIKSNGQIFKRKTVRKDKRIFALYKSFQGDDQEQHSNPLKYIIIILIVAFIGLGFFFYDMITPDPIEPEKIVKTQKKVNHENQKTQFKNEIKLQTVKNVTEEVKIDLEKIRAIEIISKVIQNDKLYAFEDPITKKWYFYFENPYHIERIEQNFYIIISLKRYQQIKLEHDFLS